jgi:hypothetical protein
MRKHIRVIIASPTIQSRLIFAEISVLNNEDLSLRVDSIKTLSFYLLIPLLVRPLCGQES